MKILFKALGMFWVSFITIGLSAATLFYIPYNDLAGARIFGTIIGLIGAAALTIGKVADEVS